MSAPDRDDRTASTAAGTEAPSWPSGTLVVDIGLERIALDMIGGGNWMLPLGIDTLVAGPLEHADRPRPEQLTNALGAVADHLDDVLIEAPIVASTPELVFRGPTALTVARVELGLDDVPQDYVLERVDADEVFRTLVAESRAERLHNPGLPADEVDSVVAGCCVILAFLRRLEHREARVVG